MTDIDELLEQRGKQWGDAVDTHVRIAKGWSGILNQSIQPVQVALCLDYLKTIRAAINPDEPDSFDDKLGYTKIAQLIAGHRDSLSDAQPQLKYELPEDQPLTCQFCGGPRLIYHTTCGATGCIAKARGAMGGGE